MEVPKRILCRILLKQRPGHQEASNSHPYEDRAYTPTTLLPLWNKNVPSGASSKRLDSTIMDLATPIINEEVTAACRDSRLKLSASELKITHLSPADGLEQKCRAYMSILLRTWGLLTSLLVAENDYEC
jgi:hypothetical protein